MKNDIESTYPSPQTNQSTPLSSTILRPTTFPLNVYNTPRKRKVAPSTPGAPIRPNPPVAELRPWPRLGRKVPLDILEDATAQIFGHKPYDWQLKLAVKVLEGHDAIGLAGTGRGKSLIFGILAIAAALTGVQGTVIVICPLKSLQTDQVRRFNAARSITLPGQKKEIRITAIAVNEDNHDEAIFTSLGKGLYHICYASPEIMLRNSHFKKLFRMYEFRRKVVGIIVDEAHVIESWKDEFRKDYGELKTLRVIAGTEIPWLALTGTCSTKTFETIYQTLGMGGSRPFYGLDLGSDRPNLSLWVRPIEYPLSTMADLFAFIPKNPKTPSDLTKTIIYLKTRKLARRACDLCRAVLPPELRKCLYSFTAVNSEGFKEEVMNLLRDGKDCRIVFATIACGMGTDIPDIEVVVIYGVDTLSEAFQKGGRAGRSRELKAKMVWLVEQWAFEETMVVENPSKKMLNDRKHLWKHDLPPSRCGSFDGRNPPNRS